MQTIQTTSKRTLGKGGTPLKRHATALLLATALVLASAASALAASDNAGCVGQFSAFFAHAGQRSEVATDFAHNARPAGANVYSNIAKLHGTLEECVEQTS
jgi:hypothetical protein